MKEHSKGVSYSKFIFVFALGLWLSLLGTLLRAPESILRFLGETEYAFE